MGKSPFGGPVTEQFHLVTRLREKIKARAYIYSKSIIHGENKSYARAYFVLTGLVQSFGRRIMTSSVGSISDKHTWIPSKCDVGIFLPMKSALIGNSR